MTQTMAGAARWTVRTADPTARGLVGSAVRTIHRRPKQDQTPVGLERRSAPEQTGGRGFSRSTARTRRRAWERLYHEAGKRSSLTKTQRHKDHKNFQSDMSLEAVTRAAPGVRIEVGATPSLIRSSLCLCVSVRAIPGFGMKVAQRRCSPASEFAPRRRRAAGGRSHKGLSCSGGDGRAFIQKE